VAAQAGFEMQIWSYFVMGKPLENHRKIWRIWVHHHSYFWLFLVIYGCIWLFIYIYKSILENSAKS